jgi:hypothetical protein
MSHTEQPLQTGAATSDEDLVRLLELRLSAQKQRHSFEEAGSSEEAPSDDPDYDEDADIDAADAAASKFMKSAKANKAGRRKARKAAAAAAAPAGDATTPAGLADSAVAGPPSSQEAKHDRKQKQKQIKPQTVDAASSSSGIAEGHLSVRDQDMLKHALTQMSYLKQVAPFTFEIQKGAHLWMDAQHVGTPAAFRLVLYQLAQHCSSAAQQWTGVAGSHVPLWALPCTSRQHPASGTPG